MPPLRRRQLVVNPEKYRLRPSTGYFFKTIPATIRNSSADGKNSSTEGIISSMQRPSTSVAQSDRFVITGRRGIRRLRKSVSSSRRPPSVARSPPGMTRARRVERCRNISSLLRPTYFLSRERLRQTLADVSRFLLQEDLRTKKRLQDLENVCRRRRVINRSRYQPRAPSSVQEGGERNRSTDLLSAVAAARP